MLINFDSLKGFWNGLKVYISDKIKDSRGDWNQNNPEADNYIKNRPFYSESKTTETVIFPSINVECIYEDGMAQYITESNVVLLADMDYRVMFDGVEYNCRCVGYDDGSYYLGNVGAIGMPGFSETGEPFIVASEGGMFIVATFDTETTTHNISIAEINTQTTIKKIDGQYLPAMDYVSYAEVQGLTDEQKTQARENIGAGTSSFTGDYNDLSNKPDPFDPSTLATVATTGDYNDLSNKPETNMVLKDFDTSYRYNVFIKNGTLATLAMCSSIRVDSIPDKRYIEGDTLDLTGAVVVAVCEDGSERQVLDFTYPEAVLTESSQVEISYVEFGSVFTVTVDIPIISLIGIRVDSIPDVEYIPGAILDLSDAIVYATFSDGTEKQITDFTYPDTVPNNYQVEIIYSTWGSTVSTIVYLPVNNIEDFNYTENEDGTKTLTGWKGTFLGESSTEIIIPDDESVIV